MIHKYNITISFIILLFICSSCRIQTSQNQVEKVALNFCEAYYNFNFIDAKEWVTPSSLSYLSFLASNIQQEHLDQLNAQGAATVTVRESQLKDNSEKATIICEIKNSLQFNPITGQTENIPCLLDTLQLVKENNNWLIRKDNLQQNGK